MTAAKEMATWPSGKAEACKAFTPGSNPGVASNLALNADMAQLVEHHLAKVRVAGSNPVVRSRTSKLPAGSFSFASLGCAGRRPWGLWDAAALGSLAHVHKKERGSVVLWR